MKTFLLCFGATCVGFSVFMIDVVRDLGGLGLVTSVGMSFLVIAFVWGTVCAALGNQPAGSSLAEALVSAFVMWVALAVQMYRSDVPPVAVITAVAIILVALAEHVGENRAKRGGRTLG